MIYGVSVVFWSLLMALGIVWGSSFYAVSVALHDFKPMQIAAGRILIGAFILTVLCFICGDGLPSFARGQRRVWLYSFGMGAFTNAIPFSLLSWAQTDVSSSFAGVTMSLVPFITLALAHFFILNEKLSLKKMFGLVVGFCGILILFDFFNSRNQWIGFEGWKFKLACAGAAICYSVGAIITRRSPATSKLGFSSAGLLAGTIIILPMTMFIDGFPTFFGVKSLFAMAYLGVLPTGLATVILVIIIKNVGPTFLSLVNYLVPIWAIIFGVVFNSEEIGVSFLIALVFIFSGMILSQRPSRKK